MGQVAAVLGDNAIHKDAQQAAQELRQQHPKLLQPDEKIIYAFQDRGGKGRDDKFFTDRRILIRNVKFMSGKCVNYKSIPYYSIKAWSVDTAAFADTDCSLRIWREGRPMRKFDFVAGQVDMYALKRFFNDMILIGGAKGAEVAEGAVAKTGRLGIVSSRNA